MHSIYGGKSTQKIRNSQTFHTFFNKEPPNLPFSLETRINTRDSAREVCFQNLPSNLPSTLSFYLLKPYG